MIPLLTADQMRRCDNATIQNGTSSRTLMERAAHAAIQVLKDELSPTHATRILVLCGSGNNGGDGFAMARFLWEEGYHVTVCYAGAWDGSDPDVTRMSEECARQAALWMSVGGKVHDDLPPLPRKDGIVVDALFGIGLDRPPVGKIADWIETVNQSTLPILAVDIPSGVSADTGKVPGHAIHATVTATIACPKIGLLLYPGAAYAGKVTICDIGITTEVLGGTVDHWYVTPSDLAALPSRPRDAHKGTFGRVLIIGGAIGMCGAPYFAAKAAYRTGTGLVEVMTASDNRIPLQTLIPEAVFTAWNPSTPMSDSEIAAILTRADAVVLGCGLGQSDAARTLTEQVLHLCQRPLVLDADALNLIAAHNPLRDALKARNAPTVLTPHLGEAARLSGLNVPEITSDLINTANELAARHNATCVLKDARSVVSDGQRTYVQDRGNSGMATGGSGDCLAGIIGSLLCQYRSYRDLSPTKLAALGVLLHAMAGDCTAQRLGEHAIMASDIADATGDVLRDLNR